MSITTVLLEGERICTWLKNVRLINNPFIKGNFWLDQVEFLKRVKVFKYKENMDPTLTGFFYVTNYRMLFVDPKTGSFIFAVPYKQVGKFQLFPPKADRSGVYVNPTYTFVFDLFTPCNITLEIDNPPPDKRQTMVLELTKRIDSCVLYQDPFAFEHGINIIVKPLLDKILSSNDSSSYQTANINIQLVSHYWDQLPKETSPGWKIYDNVRDFLRMGVAPFNVMYPDKPIATDRLKDISIKLTQIGIDQSSGMIKNAKYTNSFPHMAKYFKDMKEMEKYSHYDGLENGWKMTTINSSYQLCDTYPAILALPSEFLKNGDSVQTLNAIASHRSRGRLPILSYRNPITGTSLSRCAQPNSGITNKQSSEDDYLISTIRGTSIIIGDVKNIVDHMDKQGELKTGNENEGINDTNETKISIKLDDCNYSSLVQKRTIGILKGINSHSKSTISQQENSKDIEDTNCAILRNGPPVVLLFDCRPRVAAVVNGIMGKGTEKTTDMGKVIFLNIDNIHKVRDAFNSMKSIHMYRPSNCFKILGERKIEGGQITTVGNSPNTAPCVSTSSFGGAYPCVGTTAQDLDALDMMDVDGDISTSISQNIEINYSNQSNTTQSTTDGNIPPFGPQKGSTSLPPWIQNSQNTKQQVTGSSINLYNTSGTCVTNEDLSVNKKTSSNQAKPNIPISYSYATSKASDPSYVSNNQYGQESVKTTEVVSLPTKHKGLLSKLKGKVRGTSAVEKGLSVTSVKNVLGAEKVICNNRKVTQIHSSLHPLGESLRILSAGHIAEDDNLLKGITESTYYFHIRTILAGALIIAQQMTDSTKGMNSYGSSSNIINVNRFNCIVHCSDGWDRTSLLSALASILQDPYYRTIYGFIQITEREFGSGHMYSTRTRNIGASKIKVEKDKEKEAVHNPYSFVQNAPSVSTSFKESQVSPIFTQYIESVRCIQRQYPGKFEFNEEFLLFLLYHLYSGRYGTFLFDCEHDRVIYGSPLMTMSVWDPMIESIDETKPVYRSYAWKSRFVNPSFSWEAFDRDMKYEGLEYLDINLSQYKIKPWKRFWRQHFQFD